MTQYAIKTEHLSYAYSSGQPHVVHDLDIRVERGKIYSFLGPNGAGKSTTIKLILGLIRPIRGVIELAGHPMVAGGHQQDIFRQTGILVESPGLYQHLSGLANLKIQARMRGVSLAQISEVLARVDMLEAAGRKVKTYSTGMKQRLGLAAALLHNPSLLILDEPTNGLDPKGIREIRDLLISLNRDQNITIFLSTHLLSEAEKVSHQIGIIQKGKLLFQGTRNELKSMRTAGMIAKINTNNNAEAHKVLSEGRQVQTDEEGYLLVECEQEKDITTFNRKLVESGLDVYYAAIVQEDLEDMFLNLTNNGKE